MTFTSSFLSRIHQGEPPKTYQRPKCPWCKRPLGVTIVKGSAKSGSGFKATDVPIGYKYKGSGHFCSDKHAGRWANEELDRREKFRVSLVRWFKTQKEIPSPFTKP